MHRRGVGRQTRGGGNGRGGDGRGGDGGGGNGRRLRLVEPGAVGHRTAGERQGGPGRKRRTGAMTGGVGAGEPQHGAGTQFGPAHRTPSIRSSQRSSDISSPPAAPAKRARASSRSAAPVGWRCRWSV